MIRRLFQAVSLVVLGCVAAVALLIAVSFVAVLTHTEALVGWWLLGALLVGGGIAQHYERGQQ